MGFKEQRLGTFFADYYYVRFFLRNIVILITFVVIASCGKQDNKDIITSKDNSIESRCDTVSILCDKCIKKHDISNPDYVPPSDGGVNGKWCNNRHRMLTNDSNCYFKRSSKKK
jgi:hypothetical protein